MPTLIDKTGPLVDSWRWLDDEQPLPAGSKVIVSLSRWHQQCELLPEVATAVGVLLEPDTEVADLRPALDRIDLIAIRFHVFSDGRGFSQARLLHERYAYSKPIRAVGEVLRDQLAFMARCGITQFSLQNEDDTHAALRAFSEISVGYQADLPREVG